MDDWAADQAADQLVVASGLNFRSQLADWSPPTASNSICLNGGLTLPADSQTIEF
jgi:hypothetical protein